MTKTALGGRRMNKGTARVRIDEARQMVSELQGITGQSARRFDELLSRFEKFAAIGFSMNHLDEITSTHIEQFVKAKGRSGVPSAATMQMRRTSLRLLFRVARMKF